MVPIQFCQNEQGALVIVSGHCRVTAAGKAWLTSGLKTTGTILSMP